MGRPSRRTVIASAGAIAAVPLGEWLKGCTPASEPAPPPHTGRYRRRDVNDPEAADTVEAYRRAVKVMMERPAKDPTSWRFQANIHGVRRKDEVIDELYTIPSGAGREDRRELAEWRAIAEKTFATCTHTTGEVALAFFTWHRMYLYFFERIVRAASGDPSFALPYWNYSLPNARALPAAFRIPADGSVNALFRYDRNDGVNSDTIEDARFLADDDVDVSRILAQRNFKPDERDRGFSVAMEQGVHGQIHVRVGNSRGMGSLSAAAQDPIFWLHHCNIDRLWSSWVLAGGENPTDSDWLDKSHAFADENGQLVTMTTRDILKHIDQLDYEYDRLESEPIRVASNDLGTRSLVVAQAETLATQGGSSLELGSGPAELTLEAETTRSLVPQSLRDQIRNLPEGKRVFLILEDIQVPDAPGVVYRVFLNLPQGENPDPDSPHFVGPMNLFGLAMGSDHAGHDAPGAERSFDVTNVVKNLIGLGLWTDDAPRITVVPRGAPVGARNPVVRGMRLVVK